MIKQFASLFDMMEAFPDEQSCIDHLRSIRWKTGSHCPYCGSTKVYDFSDKRTHKCGDCRQRFSIKVGTIFEDSKIPLPFLNTYRTMCIAPEPDFKRVLEDIRELQLAA